MRNIVRLALVVLAVQTASVPRADVSSDQKLRGAPGQKSVCFTVDDLPASRSGSLSDMRRINDGMLAKFKAFGIPAIGFVNESKLEAAGEESARVALLQAWLDQGHDLGNHGYRHVRFYDASLADMQRDVLDGERVTRKLLAERGRTPRWFRHPTLSTGPDATSRAAFEAFLAEHGYAVAPVTLDNDEWIYAAAYDRARTRGDRAALARLGRDYLRYMEEAVQFHEQLSQKLFQRDIAHVLLIHANALNAEYVDDVARMFTRRGYRFVSLDEALADPAYRSTDTYVGPNGFSWLQRWAVSRGQPAGEQPTAPDWVQQAMR